MDVLFFITNVFNDAAAILLFVSGFYFSFKHGFFRFGGLRRVFQSTLGGLKGNGKRDVLRLFSASLAGAAGVGNITGVAAALFVGGPGAVFWMWTAAFLGMATKYTETSLALRYKSEKNGYNSSPMSYLSAFRSKILPVLFAFFGVAVSLLMGNLVQSRALSETAFEAYGVPKAVSGVIIFLIILPIISGGFKRIGAFAEKAVPVMTAFYIVLCGVVLIIFRDEIIPAFRDIFVYAFRPMSAAGGFMGAGMSAAIRSGVSKGIFSNEAGLGSAGLAYGNGDVGKADEKAMWGAFDVFADTIIISTFSALVLLTTGAWRENGSVIGVFGEIIGKFGLFSGVICFLLFAIASMLTWEYYGEACFAYLSNGRFIGIFRIVFVVLAFVGAMSSPVLIWSIAEIANTGMMGINMIGVLRLSHRFGERKKEQNRQIA